MDMQELEKTQCLTLKNREYLTVDMVENVEHFSPEEILLKTATGGLKIRGSNLRLEDLSKGNGGISLTGKIDSMDFTDIKEKHGFFKDLFR